MHGLSIIFDTKPKKGQDMGHKGTLLHEIVPEIPTTGVTKPMYLEGIVYQGVSGHSRVLV